MLQRLVTNWVYGGSLAGVLLLLLAPLLTRTWPASLAATFLLLPVYMVHQYEEHDDDRFRRFVNGTMGHGHEVLSRGDVFVINVPGVWGVIAISVYLAATVHVGFALIAVYLVLVNAVVHVLPALILRRYNPGLVTALVLFFPFGGFALRQVQQAGGGAAPDQALGLGLAIAIHAAIMLHVRRNVLAAARAT
ncbi:MAG: HXXEE domain-containing protein [Acidobacteriota bacterium]|nr:HXXEE domain-containing protein [Acidobacteriota bacterium]